MANKQDLVEKVVLSTNFTKKDANEAVKMIHELEDSKLRELDIEMRKKPKFDKCKNKEEKNHKK